MKFQSRASAGIMAVFLALALCAANTILGSLNLDEGWYLLAAKNTADGMRPYRDFFFTQAPLMPVIYGWLEPLWGDFGVLGGRIATALLGMAASVIASLAAAVASRPGRRFAAGLTIFLLLQCNTVHSYFTVIPKTYALASLFVSLGALALAFAMRCGTAVETSRRPAAFFSGLFFAFAAGTRLSLGAVLPAVGLFLLFSHRRHPLAWMLFGLGGIFGLAVSFLPFIAGCWDQFAFANFFHGGRGGGGMAMACGSMARLLRNYLPVGLLALAAICMRTVATTDRSQLHSMFYVPCLLAFAAIFVIHTTAPFPYDDYNTPAMPLVAMAVSVLFWESMPSIQPARIPRLLAAFAVVAAMFAAASPFCESWLVVRKDRFWVETKNKPDILLLREIGRELENHVNANSALLTQDAYLAVEADRPVPQGFEMGPFGFFGDLSDDDARKYHVLNRNLAIEAIKEGGWPAAAFSGYAFSMSAPALRKDDALAAEMLELAQTRYATLATIPDFGQEHTRLWIGTRADADDAQSISDQRATP